MKQTRTARISFLALALGTAFSFNASAQQIATRANEGKKAFPDRITFNEGMTESALVPVLEDELGWPTGYGMKPQGRPIVDKLGYSHQRYQQTVSGIPVFGATLAVHSQKGQLRSMNGELLSAKAGNGDGSPSVEPQDAIERAKHYVGAKSYMWESPEMEAFIKREQNNPEASFKPVAELVYYPLSFPKLSGELRLAYELDVYALSPRSRQEVLVDARTGEVLASFERMHTIDEPGTAQTAYSGNRPIVTYRPSTTGPYQLEDHSRGSGIITYDCQNTDNYDAAQVPVNPANNWDFGSLYDNSILDAHWGTERTYDFYHNEQNWDSYDNNNSPLLSYAHFNLIAFGYGSNNNAFWDGQRMTYGDGDGTTRNPYTAVEVTGHEITHGVTEHTAGLVYQNEPGALNESFSDIMGSCIEYYAKPEDFSWEIGNDMSVSGSGSRNMANPKSKAAPDTYHGEFWISAAWDNGGVHTNSGVQNYWFYLLSEGGTGTNDNGDIYHVEGIGIEEAGDIAFRSLSIYMTANSGYADARANSIQAAMDLFGTCSPEIIAVTNAWYAVGVGVPSNDAVVSGFTASSYYRCTPSATIQFTNGSLNASSYFWDFGDGTTSTTTSPTHTYNDAGSFNPSLIATGTSQCNTSDTLVLSQPILVDDVGELLPATCQPYSFPSASYEGIFRVRFGTIDNSSPGAVDFYEDFSCDVMTTVTEGVNYPLIVELQHPYYVAMWIDMNNDGAFSTTEMVYNSVETSAYHAADVMIPAGSIFDMHLRARVMSSSQPITSACVLQHGQAEDYSVIILDNVAPPIAIFTADQLTIPLGASVSFHDLSLNVPTQWSWAFEGGDITSSTLQNPQMSYSATGIYDVQLIVANAHGSDTLLMPGLIHVVNSFNLCDVSTISDPSGIFYDPGGETGNYHNNELCTLLIAPPCATSITVTIDAIHTEHLYDNLVFFDGDTSTAPLIGIYSGSYDVSPFTTSGGQLFVRWASDGSGTDEGFVVEWTSQIDQPETLHTVATANNMNPAYDETVQFSDSSAEAPSSWHWDFGDGFSSDLQNPVHHYFTSGAKTVILSASNCISTDQDTLYLNVQEPGTMAISPDTLFLIGTSCEDSLRGSFMLYSTGTGSLNWTLAPALIDNFEEAGYNANFWASSSGGINSPDCGVVEGGFAHRFSSNSRTIKTLPLPLAENAHFSFYLKYGSGGTCEAVDSGEYVVLEYALNGLTWMPLDSWENIPDYLDWTLVDVVIPAAAASDHTTLRLRQVAHGAAEYDVWAIDHVTLDVDHTEPFNTYPDQGAIPVGDSTEVFISLPTSTMSPGNSQYMIQVRSNDPAHPSMEVPVSVTMIDLGSVTAQITYTDPNGNNGSVDFSCMGSGATQWTWDFGDGSSSAEEAPAHTYTTEDDYTVILTASNDAGCTVTDTTLVHYGYVGIAEIDGRTIIVLPNPSNGHFTVRLSGITGAVRGLMTDATGRTVSTERIFLNGENAVDISGLANGSYILRLQVGEELRYVRIMKQ